MELIKTLMASAKIDPGQIPNIPNISPAAALTNALDIVYFVAGVIAVIVIIIAGFTFTTAVYDQARITQAKNAILFAVVGLVVIMIAFLITQFIMGKF